MDTEQFNQLQTELAKTWQLDTNEFNPLLTSDDLFNCLKERVEYLLKYNMEKLLSAMYRLDISERKFDEAMNLSGVQNIAHALTQAIFDRELLRIETRRKYTEDQKKLEQ